MTNAAKNRAIAERAGRCICIRSSPDYHEEGEFKWICRDCDKPIPFGYEAPESLHLLIKIYQQITGNTGFHVIAGPNETLLNAVQEHLVAAILEVEA